MKHISYSVKKVKEFKKKEIMFPFLQMFLIWLQKEIKFVQNSISFEMNKSIER